TAGGRVSPRPARTPVGRGGFARCTVGGRSLAQPSTGGSLAQPSDLDLFGERAKRVEAPAPWSVNRQLRRMGWASSLGAERPLSVVLPMVVQRLRSTGSAALIASAEASTIGWYFLASSVSRAASFTGSPMTVNSKRLSWPT